MWRFRLQNITSAKVEVNDTGQRVVTVYTPLSTAMGSPDWEEFRLLRSKLSGLADPRKGFDEIRIQSLSADESDKTPVRLEELGDPEV
jgi:hypothetical protein